MPDIVDRAQELEQAERDEALAARAAVAAETPALHGGRRVCLDCDDPLSRARLRAHPHAVRCVECQARAERAQRPH